MFAGFAKARFDAVSQPFNGRGSRRGGPLLYVGSILLVFQCLFVTSFAAEGSSPARGDYADPPGALVRITMTGKVGVLLDEIPSSQRGEIVRKLFHQPSSFWITRAHEQIKLMVYRLSFRSSFYAAAKKQLPLPPESLWRINLTSTPHRRIYSGHDLIIVTYRLTSMLVTDEDSPGSSEPNLSVSGGRWSEPFVLPLDPELLFERTRFACLNESEFPPHSVDSEEVASFYDYTCRPQEKLSNRACHQTELPTMSCEQALREKIGDLRTDLQFERLPWDEQVARPYIIGDVTNLDGPDLQVYKAEFRTNRLIYRYISSDSCTIAERCVGGTGWRRLLQFSTADENTGTKDLDIGSVDYFVEGKENPLQQHHVFEYSACHNHYHFTHYGQFSFGDAVVSKRGFCLQSTNRVANRTSSPLGHDYGDCRHQGVSAGWVDEYKAGLECQWVDVTDVDTQKSPVARDLKFVSNPDGFLCEGNYVSDEAGNQLWERTTFTTSKGEPVDRPKCDFFKDWFANNVDSYSVTLPVSGDGFLTTPCGHGELGPLRNCGFKYDGVHTCKAGTQVEQKCTSRVGMRVLRLCDASVQLHSGTACKLDDALANIIVTSGGTNVSFACPAARDVREPGGLYSMYEGQVSLGNVRRQNVVCVPKFDGR